MKSKGWLQRLNYKHSFAAIFCISFWFHDVSCPSTSEVGTPQWNAKSSNFVGWKLFGFVEWWRRAQEVRIGQKVKENATAKAQMQVWERQRINRKQEANLQRCFPCKPSKIPTGGNHNWVEVWQWAQSQPTTWCTWSPFWGSCSAGCVGGKVSLRFTYQHHTSKLCHLPRLGDGWHFFDVPPPMDWWCQMFLVYGKGIEQ